MIVIRNSAWKDDSNGTIVNRNMLNGVVTIQVLDLLQHEVVVQRVPELRKLLI